MYSRLPLFLQYTFHPRERFSHYHEQCVQTERGHFSLGSLRARPLPERRDKNGGHRDLFHRLGSFAHFRQLWVMARLQADDLLQVAFEECLYLDDMDRTCSLFHHGHALLSVPLQDDQT